MRQLPYLPDFLCRFAEGSEAVGGVNKVHAGFFGGEAVFFRVSDVNRVLAPVLPDDAPDVFRFIQAGVAVTEEIRKVVC